jgi:hypothetical protein
MTEAVALARDDPAAARQLLSTLSALTRSEMAFHGVRDDLIALGVPSEHLPRTLGEQRAHQTQQPLQTSVTSLSGDR